MLKACDLGKIYGKRQVVRNVSLEVHPGEIIGLLGPNGAGKTTSFYMIVGLVKPNEGQVFLGSEELTSMPLHKRAHLGIGYLPQEASIFRSMTVEENIYSVLENRIMNKRVRKQRLEELISDFGLNHVATSLGQSLSGGERRRVEIARTLALDPKFILLDEPFAGVDPLAVGEIQNLITTLSQKNIGVLITDHNVRETLGVVHRAYVMNAGTLLVSGSPQEIIQDERAKKFYLGEEFKM